MHLLLFNIYDSIRSLGWHGAFELLRDGIVLGSLYSLVALGYSLVYGILKLLNFAHGDVFMVGAFMGYGVLTVLGTGLNPILGTVRTPYPMNAPTMNTSPCAKLRSFKIP